MRGGGHVSIGPVYDVNVPLRTTQKRKRGESIVKTRNFLGDALVQLRLEQGMPQGELAARLGVSQSTVCKYETGSREPGARQIQAIADALDIPVGMIFETARQQESLA